MNEHSDSETALAENQAVKAPSDVAPSTRINHGGGKLAEVIIHVRFRPNGLVNTINQRPEHIDPQGWFDRLCRAAPLTYQPLSGGRGAFRIPSAEFDVIWRDNAG